jgi:hypothetical protein
MHIADKFRYIQQEADKTHNTLEGTAYTLKWVIRGQLLGNASVFPATP